MAALLLSACASTRVTVTPQTASTEALCQAPGERLAALVLWTPKWRADQKEVAQREQAAEQGIARFFAGSACFAQAEVKRIPLEAMGEPPQLQRIVEAAGRTPDRVLLLSVRELGPVLKLGASPALVDGGTEVVLDIGQQAAGVAIPARAYTVHWQHGGPGVLKGTGGLAADMEAALQAGLKARAQ